MTDVISEISYLEIDKFFYNRKTINYLEIKSLEDKLPDQYFKYAYSYIEHLIGNTDTYPLKFHYKNYILNENYQGLINYLRCFKLNHSTIREICKMMPDNRIYVLKNLKLPDGFIWYDNDAFIDELCMSDIRGLLYICKCIFFSEEEYHHIVGILRQPRENCTVDNNIFFNVLIRIHRI